MAILVDGDACPDLDLIKDVAIKKAQKMIVYVDYSHNILDDYFVTVFCETGKDNVDLALFNDIKEDDIVITQDYGLASLALTRKAMVLHVSGKIIDNDNIDELLLSRYLSSKERRSNVHLKGPKKRNSEVRKYFLEQLERVLDV